MVKSGGPQTGGQSGVENLQDGTRYFLIYEFFDIFQNQAFEIFFLD